MQKLWLVIKRFRSFEGSLFRYSLAYSFLLALLPTLIVIVMLFHSSVLDAKLLLEYLYRFFPEKFLEPFVTYLMDKEYHGITSIVVSLVAAFYLASKSIYSFMLISAQNEGFNIPKILIRIKSYVLFVVLVTSVSAISLLASIFEYPASIVFSVGLFVVFMILYRTLTFEKKPAHYGLIGAIFSTVIIILFSYLFLAIVEYFTSYNTVYGPMGSLVIALLSIYVSSSVIYFGYCLNLVMGPSFAKREYKHEKVYMLGVKASNKFKSGIKSIIGGIHK